MSAAPVEAPEVEGALREREAVKCAGCGRRVSRWAITGSATRDAGQRAVQHRCAACTRAARRRSRDARPPPLPVAAPASDSPPVLLRHELARQRERGRPWSSAWPYSLTRALADLPPEQRAEWRMLLGEVSGEWRRGRALGLVLPD